MTESSADIRVAIVDDHPVVREGTATLLANQQGIAVVGTAGCLDDAAALLDATKVDVLLLDLRLGSESGLSLLGSGFGRGDDRDRGDDHDRGEGHPGPERGRLPAIVVVTAYDYPQYVAAALRLGAAGYVLKTAPVAELFDAIRKAAAGGVAFGVRPSGNLTSLTPREREVVGLVVDGRSNDEIGAALGITSKTVEAHLRRLFDRLGLQSRTELATRALREGWLELP